MSTFVNSVIGLLLIISSVAQAMPPRDVPKKNVLEFAQMQEIYRAGQPTSEALLKGTWIKEAYAYTESCVSQGEPNADYDLHGIKNPDGSVDSLKFSRVTVPGNEFSGTPAKHIFSVEVLNVGNTTNRQGPYRVDPYTPQFSRYAIADDGTQGQEYYEYSCRMVNGSTDHLICGLKYVAIYSDSYCALRGLGKFLGFKKVNP